MNDSEHKNKKPRTAGSAIPVFQSDDCSVALKDNLVKHHQANIRAQRIYHSVYQGLGESEEHTLSCILLSHVCYIVLAAIPKEVQSQLEQRANIADDNVNRATKRFIVSLQRELRHLQTGDIPAQYDISMHMQSSFCLPLPLRKLLKKKDRSAAFSVHSFWERMLYGKQEGPYCCYLLARQRVENGSYSFLTDDGVTVLLDIDSTGSCGCSVYKGSYTCFKCHASTAGVVQQAKGYLSTKNIHNVVISIQARDILHLPDLIVTKPQLSQVFLCNTSLLNNYMSCWHSLLYTNDYLASITYISDTHNHKQSIGGQIETQIECRPLSSLCINTYNSIGSILTPKLLSTVYGIPIYSMKQEQPTVQHTTSQLQRYRKLSTLYMKHINSSITINIHSKGSYLVAEYANNVYIPVQLQCMCDNESDVLTSLYLYETTTCTFQEYDLVQMSTGGIEHILYCVLEESALHQVTFRKQAPTCKYSQTEVYRDTLPTEEILLCSIQYAKSVVSKYTEKNDIHVIIYIHTIIKLGCTVYVSIHNQEVHVCIVPFIYNPIVPRTSYMKLGSSIEIDVPFLGVKVLLCDGIEVHPGPPLGCIYTLEGVSTHCGVIFNDKIVTCETAAMLHPSLDAILAKTPTSMCIYRGKVSLNSEPVVIIWLCGNSPLPVVGSIVISNQISISEPIFALSGNKLTSHRVYIGGDWCNQQVQQLHAGERLFCIYSLLGCISTTNSFTHNACTTTLPQTLSRCMRGKDTVIKSVRAQYLYILQRAAVRLKLSLTIPKFDQTDALVPQIPNNDIIEWRNCRMVELSHAMFWLECSSCQSHCLTMTNQSTDSIQCRGCEKVITHFVVYEDSVYTYEDHNHLIHSSTLIALQQKKGVTACVLHCALWGLCSNAVTVETFYMHTKQCSQLLKHIPLTYSMQVHICMQVVLSGGAQFQYNRYVFERQFRNYSSESVATVHPEHVAVQATPVYKDVVLSPNEVLEQTQSVTMQQQFLGSVSNHANVNRQIGYTLHTWEDSFDKAMTFLHLPKEYTYQFPLYQHIHQFQDGFVQKAFQQRRGVDQFTNNHRTDLSLLHTQSIEYKCSLHARIYEEKDNTQYTSSLLHNARNKGFLIPTQLSNSSINVHTLQRQVATQTQVCMELLNELTQRTQDASQL